MVGWMRGLVLVGLGCCLGVLRPALAQPAPEDEALNFPSGDGVALVPYQPTTSVRLSGKLYDVSFLRPSGWLVHYDGSSWLMEPSPNPGDLGVVVVVASGAVAPTGLGDVDGRVEWGKVLGGLVGRVEEVGRERRERAGSDRKPYEVEVVRLSGQFDNGQPARWLAASWRDGDVFVAVIAGAGDRAYEPYESLLRDLLLSIQFTPHGTPP